MEQDFHSKDTGKWSAGLRKQTFDSDEFYTVERQINANVEMICFCLKSGTKRAFPTVIFDEINLQPETGIVLYSRTVTIHITGKHLDKLYQLLIRRRVKEIREFNGCSTDEMEVYVSAITIHSDYDRH
jgi:hypothetical protein